MSGLHRHPGVRRFSRYVLGSGVAFGASQLTFLTLYGLGLAGPEVASVAAFAAGVPVNYVLNRRWAWRRRGRPDLLGELLPYAAVIAVSIVATALGTATAERALAGIALPRVIDVLLVGGTFGAINAALFVVKFTLLDRLVFNRRGRGTDAGGGDGDVADGAVTPPRRGDAPVP